jgi:mono/diheme cytochrome c family protein
MRLVAVAALGALMLGACAQQDAPPLSGEALVARGDYLVNGVVLCGDCHTPRVEGQGEGGPPDLQRRLQGAPVPVPPPLANYAPGLAGGPANYTEAQFVSFLQTGVRPDGSHPRPPMPPYRLNEEDARAVVAYINALPRGDASEAPPAATP